MGVITLREYQTRTVDAIRDRIRRGYRRIMVTLPTGAGKSIIMGHIAKLCTDNGKKILALMHRRQLVDQLKDRFQDCGVSSGVIMSQVRSDLDKLVQVGTVQTYSRRINFEVSDFFSDEIKKPWVHDADVVFLDEAHRSLSRTFQDTLKNYADKIVVGFTATPALSSGVAMGNYYQALIQPVSVRELINCGALVPGMYYGLSSPSLCGLKVVAGDYEKSGLGARVNDLKLIGDIVLNWTKIAYGKKTIVFAVNVKHSKALMHEFQKYDIAAEHLDAHSDDETRQDIISRFRDGEIKVLLNVDLFSEGTDIPELECVCLARPTKSIGRYLQMVGRGARPAQGKHNFLVLDHGKNVNEHGFYEDEIFWALEGNKIKYTKVVRKDKEKHKMKCAACSALFRGDTCPVCNTVVKDYGKKIEAIEFDLEEFDTKIKKKPLLSYPTEILIGMLVSEAARLGKSDSWIRANYRNICNRWPKNIHVKSVPPTQELKNMLQHLRIKWIKSQQKKS